MYELNSSGKYFAFKEQLKQSVTKIAREKFNAKSFSDPMKKQEFISNLYTFLVDEMHTSLNNTLAYNFVSPVEPVQFDADTLLRFASEAEVAGNVEEARKYLLDRIAIDRGQETLWFDYGVFCTRIGDYSKAEEVLKTS
eukprot:UC4_evm1s683